MKVKVTTPFFYDGKGLELDQVLELPPIFAREMINANRCVAVPDPDPPAEVEATEKVPELDLTGKGEGKAEGKETKAGAK